MKKQISVEEVKSQAVNYLAQCEALEEEEVIARVLADLDRHRLVTETAREVLGLLALRSMVQEVRDDSLLDPGNGDNSYT